MAVAAPRSRPVPRERPRDAPRQGRAGRIRPRPRVARSVVWIALVAALLAGIVAMNVAVLRLRMERGRLQADIVELRAQNAQIEADISAAAARGRVEAAAGGGLGLVRPSQTTYLTLDPRDR